MLAALRFTVNNLLKSFFPVVKKVETSWGLKKKTIVYEYWWLFLPMSEQNICEGDKFHLHGLMPAATVN